MQLGSRISESLTNAFQDLTFYDDTHRYVLDNKDIPSVTGFIKSYYPEFNKEVILPAYAAKHNRTEEDVEKEWDEIRDDALLKGNDGHTYGEYREDLNTVYEHRTAIQQFWDDLAPQYIEVARELRMYSRHFWRAGTTDFILLNLLTNKLIVGDYKTNKDLFQGRVFFRSDTSVSLQDKAFLRQITSRVVSCPFGILQLENRR